MMDAPTRALFFRLFKQACEAHDISQADWETFRHALIFGACPQSGGSLRNLKTREEVEAVIEAVAEATEIVRAKLNAVREHERRERLSKCLRMGIEADLHAYFRRDEVNQRRYPGLSYAEARFLQGCCKHLKIRVEVASAKTWAEAFTLQQLRRLRACVASSLRRKWAKLRKDKGL